MNETNINDNANQELKNIINDLIINEIDTKLKPISDDIVKIKNNVLKLVFRF